MECEYANVNYEFFRTRTDACAAQDGNVDDIKSITTSLIHGQVDVP
jgi:hypothetical protein